MKNLTVDYISDLHLSFYIKATSTGYAKLDIENFVEKNIAPNVNGSVLVVAGDITEFIESEVDFLLECSKYYDKVFFVAGNHEYYISSILSRIMKYEFANNSINKIKKLCDLSNPYEKLVFLDRNNYNKGIVNYNGFKIAGDTLWYLPNNIKDWIFYLAFSNDSRFILPNKTKRKMIKALHHSSMEWYESLPSDLDLIVTHVPPINNKDNSCYYCNVNSIKAPVWIYGHDHITSDLIQDNTRFATNPCGYYAKDFKLKTLTLKK